MFKKLPLLVLFVLSFTVSASDKPNASADLKALLAKLPHFSTQFEQIVVDNEGTELQRNTGSMQVKQPAYFRWEVKQPDETLLVADGNTVWYYNPFVEQVSAYSQQQMTESTPILLLAQPNSPLWANYVVTQNANSFTLTSRSSEQQAIESVEVKFVDSGAIEALVIVDSQQQTATFSFAQFDASSELSSDLFSFIPPEGVELDDQR